MQRDACAVVRVSQMTCNRVTRGKNGLVWSVWGPMHVHNRFVSRERAERACGPSQYCLGARCAFSYHQYQVFQKMGKLCVTASFGAIARTLVYRMINMDLRLICLNLS